MPILRLPHWTKTHTSIPLFYTPLPYPYLPSMHPGDLNLLKGKLTYLCIHSSKCFQLYCTYCFHPNHSPSCTHIPRDTQATQRQALQWHTQSKSIHQKKTNQLFCSMSIQIVLSIQPNISQRRQTKYLRCLSMLKPLTFMEDVNHTYIYNSQEALIPARHVLSLFNSPMNQDILSVPLIYFVCSVIVLRILSSN